ncbi:hypothetical protein THAOC_28548 [Thalassiosira oceanica]|uniref:Superoxide dismutase copper/zinc binding domain-containing protein n=1 Tax=Thalassiosira oceanica TaxID=159749 RepID=K0REW1_THAOC|nr:hypothetical protein THAOC_28548 [Thalassiosira oceanica]|eukprot:EJK52208.1 hypothetical protein THAOC_28548 [Thalassiosira oceanica]
MFRIAPIALAAGLVGSAAGAPEGCHPPYAAGGSYVSGSYVSATSTVETPVPCDCALPSCPSSEGQTAGCSTTTTTTETHNYKCVDGGNSAYCGVAGFEPATLHGYIAWTKESAQCSSGCPGAYVSGESYAAADKVSVAGPAYTAVYECAASPLNKFCGLPGYAPGSGNYWRTVWTLLGSCAGTISPTSSPNYVSLADAGGCPDAWEAGAFKYEENDKVSKNGLVFECRIFPFSQLCGLEGYEPLGELWWEDAWKTAWTVVGYCSGTSSPTTSPSFDRDPAKHVGGCPDEWVEGTNAAYEEGDMVSVTVSTSPLRKIAYTCKTWPFSGFCGLYAPNSGRPDDQQGWRMNGSCSGSIRPTAAPSFGALNLVAGGCPRDYDENNLSGIGAGDRVSLGRVVYECKSGAVSAYCSQPAFVPGGQYSAMAWDVKGYCEGTMRPTMAPTSYDNAVLRGGAAAVPPACQAEAASGGTVAKCYYEKDTTTTGVSCTCGDSDCPNPSGLEATSTACKKDVTVTSCPAVGEYASGSSYEAGDVVRVGTTRFKCREWPYMLWCRNEAYAPSLDSGIWSNAWTRDGDCPATSAPKCLVANMGPSNGDPLRYEDASGSVKICFDGWNAGAGASLEMDVAGLGVSTTGGVHIHTGTSCANATAQGGHYWEIRASDAAPGKTAGDPWFGDIADIAPTGTSYTTDANGLGTADFAFDSGTGLDDNVGRVVVIHDTYTADGGDYARVACGVLVESATLDPHCLVANMAPSNGDRYDAVSGTVKVCFDGWNYGAGANLEMNVAGLGVSTMGGVHIHTGTSCADASAQGGHYFVTTRASDAAPGKTAGDPWFGDTADIAPTGTSYTTDANGRGTADFTFDSGTGLHDNVGRVVVIHDTYTADGGDYARVACGVLAEPAP